MSININKIHKEFAITLDDFRGAWNKGKFKTFCDVEEYLGEPLDDEELDRFTQCVHDIIARRAAKLSAVIELCNRYLVINPKAKEENEQ